MKNKFTRIFALLLACAMLLSIVACARDEEGEEPTIEVPTLEEPEIVEQPIEDIESEQPIENIIDTGVLVSNLREQFTDAETVEFQESIWDLPTYWQFFVDLEFNILDSDLMDKGVYEVFGVFADTELTQFVHAHGAILTHDDNPDIPEGHSRIHIRPGHLHITPGIVLNSYFCIESRERVYLEHGGESLLHEDNRYSTWGYLSHFYLALLVDPVTAEPLERPTVQIFTLENQLEAPRSEFFLADDGRGGFRWNAIEGAEYYVIARVDEDAFDHTVLRPIAHTTDTTWIHPEMELGGMNRLFRHTVECPHCIDDGEELTVAISNLVVIAVNSEAHSAIGNVHNGAKLASRLVAGISIDFVDAIADTDGVITAGEDGRVIAAEADEEENDEEAPPIFNLLPLQIPLDMVDDRVVYRRMIYGFDCCHTITQEDDPDNPGELRYVLETCFRVEGTTFKFSIWMHGVDLDTLEEDIEAFLQRADDAALRGGGSMAIDFSNQRPHDRDIPTVEDTADKVITTTGDRIFANTALSAFLAYNMLAGNEVIDLSEFPESANWDLLIDAFFEAIYQNPLILHVAGAGSIPGTNVLFVEYKESVNVIQRQQDAIRQIVPEIIAEIITDDMTDLEKSIAINQFLVDTTEYDWDALENAEQFDFQQVDPEFNDSFTAYGILINRVGVCAGYAAAFRLLADEAGLESIVVTGYLEGFLPHAWNRVHIDGQWYTIDVTNNANEYLFNVFLHLPDDVAGSVLVEDGSFLMNDFLGYHNADGSMNEYFYVTDRFFGRTEIATELAELIRETGNATLRTNFDLNDDEFFKIAMEVISILDDVELAGFHWLGVIYMTDLGFS